MLLRSVALMAAHWANPNCMSCRGLDEHTCSSRNALSKALSSAFEFAMTAGSYKSLAGIEFDSVYESHRLAGLGRQLRGD